MINFPPPLLENICCNGYCGIITKSKNRNTLEAIYVKQAHVHTHNVYHDKCMPLGNGIGCCCVCQCDGYDGAK